MLALLLLPAAGDWAGVALAELMPVSRRTLSLALHAAAWIVLAVAGLELVTEALKGGPAWIPRRCSSSAASRSSPPSPSTTGSTGGRANYGDIAPGAQARSDDDGDRSMPPHSTEHPA